MEALKNATTAAINAAIANTEYIIVCSDDEDQVCIKCGCMPCDWLVYSDDLYQAAQDQFGDVNSDEDSDESSENRSAIDGNGENSHKRKYLFQLYHRRKYGSLGRGDCIPTPLTHSYIHRMWRCDH